MVLMAQNGHFKIRNDAYIMVGYDTYKTLSFGSGTNQPNNGKYAIEYFNGGLNFWKPWPTDHSGNYILFLRDDQNIGIGTTGDTTYRVDVSGKLRATGGVFTWSDRRLKKNIQPYKNGLDKVLQMNVVSYQYNYSIDPNQNFDLTEADSSKLKTIEAQGDIVADPSPQIGLIAQELQTLVPEAVMKDEKGLLSLNYATLVPVLIQAVQMQNQEIQILRKEIDQLKKNQR